MLSPQAVAALIALGGVIVSAIVSFVTARERLIAERRLEIAAHRTIHKILRQTRWRMRTFSAIQHHLPGFEDNELRKLLVAAGAVAFRNEKDQELWGLIDANRGALWPGDDGSNGTPGYFRRIAAKFTRWRRGPVFPGLKGVVVAAPAQARPQYG
ncbi:hypothetical protein [Sphingosinicella sp. YJ22]|uniref:hypothetical protein n=1 Tax=Sphingosinicella sp. YJ22 TaxID=1104780 RepID=UPI0014085BE1|nr:hypothetical protein [Sphingosinicella sp. YJ22]